MTTKCSCSDCVRRRKARPNWFVRLFRKETTVFVGHPYCPDCGHPMYMELGWICDSCGEANLEDSPTLLAWRYAISNALPKMELPVVLSLIHNHELLVPFGLSTRL